MSVNIDLSGKCILITGASRGIGREAALRMAQAGARVAVNYNRSADEAEEVVRAAGGDAFAIQADVSRAEDVGRMIDGVLERAASS